MRIADILRHKGTDVVTVLPEDSVSEVLDKLAERNIGAVLVCSAEREVAGVLSERDVVRELHARGAEILNARAGQVMSSPVISCRSDDSVDSVAATMTERRIRHMPVVDDGRLRGIVSIGDVVLSRIRQLEQDSRQLEQYITG